MRRHSFDPLSFIAGLLFAGVAAAALADELAPWRIDADVFWPVALLVLGAGVVLTAFVGRDRKAEDEREAAAVRAPLDEPRGASSADGPNG